MRVRNVRSLALAALVFGLAGAAHAQVVLTSEGGPATGPGISYQNFDNAPPPATISATAGSMDNGTITVAPDSSGTSGFNTGTYAAPFVVAGSSPAGTFGNPDNATDTTQYLTTGTGSVTLSFSQQQNYFGLLWGSVDAYNTLSFYEGGVNGTLVGSFTGTDVLSPANGAQDASGSAYVNFTDAAGTFDTVVASSTQYAFEFDNVAYGVVPEPASMVMCGMALVTGLGAAVRRKRKAATA